MLQLIYKKFELQIRNTTLKRELGGGLITFFAMIYIIPVNASILSNGGNGIPYGGVLIATALVAAIGSILIGLMSNLPIGVAPGMGSNVFFVATMMKQFNFSWETSLAAIIISSVITTILATLGLVEKFIKSIPPTIKHAFVVGLGVYLAYIGLKSSGIVAFDANDGLVIGDISKISVILALLGIFIILGLAIAKVKMAIVYTLIFIAFVGLIIGQIMPNKEAMGLSSFDDFNLSYKQFGDFKKVFGKGIIAIPSAFTNVRLYPALLAIVFMMLSGSSSTIISIGEITNLKNEKGAIEGSKKATLAISITAITSGVFGSSTAAGFLESNAGAKYGARTGLAAVFIGLLFILSIPLLPILEPLFKNSFVTAPALVFVGSMMIKNISKIEWADPVASASSFILLIMIWFTTSILNGLAFGLVAYSIFEIIHGGKEAIKKANIYTYIFGLLFLAYIIAIPFINF